MKSHSNTNDVFWSVAQSVCPSLQRDAWELAISSALEEYDKPSIIEGLRALHEARGSEIEYLPHANNVAYFNGILFNAQLAKQAAARREQSIHPSNRIIL